MISSQMLKGTLEGCILQIISRRETYGYEIAETLMRYGFGKIAEGKTALSEFEQSYRELENAINKLFDGGNENE